MGYDFITAFADLMFNADRDLPARLRQQDQRLEEAVCTNEELGKWLNEFGLLVLTNMLNLPDKHFHEKFGESLSFGRIKRRAFIKKIEAHGETCPRCHSKILYDQQWEKMVEEAIFKNKKTLESESDFPDDHHHDLHHHIEQAAV
jgi:hypothetical protein